MFTSWTTSPTMRTWIPPCPSTRARCETVTVLACWGFTAHLLLEAELHPDGSGEGLHPPRDVHPRDAAILEHRDVGVVVGLLDRAAAAGAGHPVRGASRAAAGASHGAAADLAAVDHPAQVLGRLALPAHRDARELGPG